MGLMDLQFGCRNTSKRRENKNILTAIMLLKKHGKNKVIHEGSTKNAFFSILIHVNAGKFTRFQGFGTSNLKIGRI